MEYKWYLIYENDYRDAKHECSYFLFHNRNDCDEPKGSGKDLRDCVDQIDELTKK